MEAQVGELYKPLFHYVRKRIRHQEDAEDLTQEIFLKLAKSNLEKVDNIKNWVYTIAKNTITDYYRKKRIVTEELENHTIEEEYNDHNVVEELSTCLNFYVEALPESYRGVMKLSEIESKSQKEIAASLNMNYVTIRSKVQRGRKKLKELFSKCCTISQGGKGSIMEYEQNEGCLGSDNCGR